MKHFIQEILFILFIGLCFIGVEYYWIDHPADISSVKGRSRLSQSINPYYEGK